MSEEQVVEGGNPGETGAQPLDPGSQSFLAGLNGEQSVNTGGSELPGEKAPDPTTAEGIIKEVTDGPPEGFPEKFWDAEKREMRVEELAKGYTNLEKLISREKVPVPQGADDKEGYDRWIEAVRPENEDTYDFGERPAELPNGLEYDEDLEASFRSAALANGLMPQQAKGLYDMFLKGQIERYDSYNKMVTEQAETLKNDLRREHGEQYPAVERRAGNVMTKYADDEFRQYLNESGLGNDARMLRMLDKIGRDMGGETRLVGNTEQKQLPADLDAAIARFREKNGKVLSDSNHPDNRRMVDELQQLYQARHPEPLA